MNVKVVELPGNLRGIKLIEINLKDCRECDVQGDISIDDDELLEASKKLAVIAYGNDSDEDSDQSEDNGQNIVKLEIPFNILFESLKEGTYLTIFNYIK
ncbi:UNKNOWN [Stylonychia lemnae]|uniref:Uncharacterized protein n=1 Tax=Stylonychia lemnae TaxID=5949 RepID=A0A078B239_STYLE|nr:UNKNOWN [Stylonychia lemnae]|eukprot:CDW87337.1 UNKNOWN [Stylonychia lemnae]